MDSERSLRIQKLAAEAARLSLSERSVFLDVACDGDAELRRAVESLLALFSETAGAETSTATDPDLTQPSEASANDDLPKTIGAYPILGLIGRGGMGRVYRAQQQSPKRVVALKVIAHAFASEELLRRFAIEAATLGRLNHPGIAQIYEAGVAETPYGRQPFFAMEVVDDALPLDQYAVRQTLTLRQRLDLLARVCDAVQYAHQNGVIHRDLKPDNILVTRDGQPKILDFGVARVTDSDRRATMQTDVGQIIGTLPYMSPEQASGKSEDVDTRSDVYAMGVIAYQLLAGRLPYDLSRRALAEAVRVIQEEEPTRLSNISRPLRGDIENIVGKALAKERDRRYTSASELAADIRRHLADEPVFARPPSAWYQIQKFSRRNRTLMGGVVATFVVLIGGIIGTSVNASRAQTAREIATQQRDRAQTAEAEVKRKLAESYAQSARLARQRGDQKSMAEHSLQAINAGFNDEIEMRLIRVEALVYLDQAAASTELKSLADRNQSGPYAGRIRLEQAKSVSFSQMERVPILAEQAVELGLPQAEMLYARALMAPTIPEAIDLMEAARRIDPYNVTTSMQLGVLLFVAGRVDEADRCFEIVGILVPDEPFSSFGRGIIQSFKGDRDGAKRFAHAGADKIGPPLGPALENLFDAITADVVGYGEQPRTSAASYLVQATTLISSTNFSANPSPGGSPATLVGFPRSLVTLYKTLLRISTIQLFNPKGASELRVEVARINPTADMLGNVYADLMAGKDRSSIDMALRAAYAPSIQRGTERIFEFAVLDAGYYVDLTDDPDEKMKYRRIMREAATERLSRNGATLILPQFIVSDLTDSGHFDLATEALARWQREQPDDPEILYAKAYLNCWRGDYRSAIQWLDKYVEVNKGQPKRAIEVASLRKIIMQRIDHVGPPRESIPFSEYLARAAARPEIPSTSAPSTTPSTGATFPSK